MTQFYFLDSLNFKLVEGASESSMTFFAVTSKEKKGWMAAFETAIQLGKEAQQNSPSQVKATQRLSLRVSKLVRAYSTKGFQKPEDAQLTISSPYGITHGVHVDQNFNWTNIDEHSFDLEVKLGEGSFGAVYKAIHKESSKEEILYFLFCFSI